MASEDCSVMERRDVSSKASRFTRKSRGCDMPSDDFETWPTKRLQIQNAPTFSAQLFWPNFFCPTFLRKLGSMQPLAPTVGT